MSWKGRQPLRAGGCQFYLGDLVGEGAYSQVFGGKRVARDGTQQTVAIKVLPKKSEDPHFKEEHIWEEIQILKNLKGASNIIEFHEVIEKENNIYVITEYCGKGTLKDLLGRRSFFSDETALKYFKQIVRGYEAINSKGIVHRDMKTENILLKDSQTVKIADFGFAQYFQEASKDEMMVGSPLYMPLELFEKGIYSEKNDVWAMGIILFQMITGKVPFFGVKVKELVKSISETDIRNSIPKHTSEDVRELIECMLQKDFKNRIGFRKLKDLLFSDQSNNPQSKIHYNSQGALKSKQKQLIKMNSFSLLRKTQQKLPEQQTGKDKQLFRKDTKKTMSSQKEPCSKKLLCYLISQIHFCRFLYKLSTRIQKIGQLAHLSGPLKEAMLGFVFKRLEQIVDLKDLPQDATLEFLQSKEYSKIEKLASEYQAKYLKELQKTKYSSINALSLLKTLKKEIPVIHRTILESENSLKEAESIAALDYLLTSYQLLRLLQKHGIQQFHHKSRIERMVESKVQTQVTEEQFKEIVKKGSALKLI